MPYRIAWEPVGVYRTYYGDVPGSERRKSLEEICGDPRFDSLRYAITDFLAAENLGESTLAALEVAALNIGPLMTNPTIILAAVAVDPSHREYVERVRSHGFIKAPYEIFPTSALARLWIAERTGVSVEDQLAPAQPDA